MSEDAYRSAGQALAAILNSLAIEHVDGDGIELADAPERQRRSVTLAEIAVGFAGIAAQDRLRYGIVEPPDFVTSWAFDDGQLADFAIVRGLIAEIDPRGTDDILFLAWQQAIGLVADDPTWRAIEMLAAEIERSPLAGHHVLRLVHNATISAGLVRRHDLPAPSRPADSLGS
jgi:hypothetical protein